MKFEFKNLNEINMAETYFDYIDGYLEGGFNCPRNKPLLNQNESCHRMRSKNQIASYCGYDELKLT